MASLLSRLLRGLCVYSTFSWISYSLSWMSEEDSVVFLISVILDKKKTDIRKTHCLFTYLINNYKFFFLIFLILLIDSVRLDFMSPRMASNSVSDRIWLWTPPPKRELTSVSTWVLGCGHSPSCPVYVILGIEPWTSCIWGSALAAELHLQPQFFLKYWISQIDKD